MFNMKLVKENKEKIVAFRVSSNTFEKIKLTRLDVSTLCRDAVNRALETVLNEKEIPRKPEKSKSLVRL